MWCRLSGPIDKSDQSGIRSEVYNVIEKRHITQAIFILRYDQRCRLKAAQTIDKIGPNIAIHRLQIRRGKTFHTFLTD
jgi:hypothetical protein